MGVEKITEKIRGICSDEQELGDMLLELFQFQLEDRGWWKDKYKEIIKKYAKEDLSK